jgi:hypothetical protein
MATTGQMKVHAIKTERYEGKAIRHMAIFADLQRHIDAAWNDWTDRHGEEPGPDDFLIEDSRYRQERANLRTTFTKIIERAGLQPWEKLFQNLRATRETELMDENPITDVASWFGHSVEVAAKHYAMSRNQSIVRAVFTASENKAAQNAAQQPSASVGNDRQEKNENSKIVIKTNELRGNKAAPLGLEPRTNEPESSVLPITPWGRIHISRPEKTIKKN